MINYASVDGTIRECSEIFVSEIKDGMVSLTQFVNSLNNEGNWDEVRRSETKVFDGEDRMDVVARLNRDKSIIINDNGKLAKLIPATKSDLVAN